MNNFLYEQFSKLVGDKLEVIDEQGNSGTLSVSQVKKGLPEDEKWSSFSIFFKNERQDFLLTQGTYLFRHSLAGERKLFISPRSESEYEASITLAKQ